VLRYNDAFAPLVRELQGDGMSGLGCNGLPAVREPRAPLRGTAILGCALLCVFFLPPASAQQRRDRETNSVYAERRAKLSANIDGPIILLGYTGKEEEAQTYIFAQEESFYYLTGHNEEDAAVILLPPDGSKAKKDDWQGPREIFFLPPKDPRKEKWNGLRMAPGDPGIEARTGFTEIRPLPELRATVERLARIYPNFYTILPYQHELGGYPHEKETVDWLKLAAPQAQLKDIRSEIADLRMVKSPTEITLLRRAVDLSVDAHFAAMKMMRPGLWEYQIAAKMVEVHAMGGSEAEAYAPIVGAGPNSTALHYDKLSHKIEDGDIVVLDVGAQYSGYAADITRTLPANGKFTPRQREIYDIVLGAQEAAMRALKPGVEMCRGDKSVYKIAYDYINSHGKDLHGKPLGQYFIHGLGHNIGLNVHDAGNVCKPFVPGMVVTVEPGIYIPEENLGVRIEDDVLITDTGYELLSSRLPRNADEIEKIMAQARAERASENVSSAGASSGASASTSASDSSQDADAIRALVSKYAQSVTAADTTLAAQVWADAPDVSFINPTLNLHGWPQIKTVVYEQIMGGMLSERKLTPGNLSIHVSGDSAWVEFPWHFEATERKDNSHVVTEGIETQIYRKLTNRGWALVHVHYTGALAPAEKPHN
jgi:Xaa-Pro aminopeptidase